MRGKAFFENFGLAKGKRGEEVWEGREEEAGETEVAGERRGGDVSL